MWPVSQELGPERGQSSVPPKAGHCFPEASLSSSVDCAAGDQVRSPERGAVGSWHDFRDRRVSPLLLQMEFEGLGARSLVLLLIRETLLRSPVCPVNFRLKDPALWVLIPPLPRSL